MATTAATLIQRTRRFLGDWPQEDGLTASVSSSANLTVADATIYSPGWLVEVDEEAMYVSAAAGTTLTVRRGVRGTTAATHANSATILRRPHFLGIEYLDALNNALDATFPLLYKPVNSEFTGDTSTAYEYDVPNMTTLSRPIPFLSELQYQNPGDTKFLRVNRWNVVRGETPLVRLSVPLEGGGRLRFIGFGPFAHLLTTADSLDSYFPYHAEDLLVEYAAQLLLASGEARRVREDTGARDEREGANKTGASMNASNAIFQRFSVRLNSAAMPPMPKHVVPVF